MRITQIDILNFRGIKNMTMTPDRVKVLAGPCGMGKTSFLYAMRFVLTGKGDAGDISVGENMMSVTVTFEDGSTLKRCVADGKGCVYVCGHKTTKASASEWLKNIYGDPAYFDVMFGADYFKDKSGREMSELLIQMLPMTITLEKLFEMSASLALPLSDAEKNALTAYLPENAIGMDDIDKAYKKLYQKRREVNAVVNRLTPLVSFKESLPVMPKQAIEKKLDELAVTEARFKQYTSQKAAYDEAVKQKETLSKDLTASEEALEKFKTQYVRYAGHHERCKAAITEDLAAYMESYLQSDISLQTKNRESFNEQISQAERLIGTLRGNIDSMDSLLSKLKTSACPFDQSIACTTDKSSFIEKTQQGIDASRTELIKLENSIPILKKRIALCDNLLKAYQQAQMQHIRHQSLLKQLKSLENIKEPERIMVRDFSRERDELNKMLAVYARFEGAEKYRAELKEREAEKQVYESLVSLLEPNSKLRRYILKTALSTIESFCNKKAYMLHRDLRLHLVQTEKGIDIAVRVNKEGPLVPVNKISSGEFMIVSYLLLSSVHTITGTRCLFLDSLDKLDHDSLNSLIDLILDDAKDDSHPYDNVFLTTVHHKESVSLLTKKGLITSF